MRQFMVLVLQGALLTLLLLIIAAAYCAFKSVDHSWSYYFGHFMGGYKYVAPVVIGLLVALKVIVGRSESRPLT